MRRCGPAEGHRPPEGLVRPDRLGVVGLGAIGGSVAWQAVRAGLRSVVGFSPVPAEAAAAARAGALTDIATSPEHLAASVDLVVLAAPPAATARLLNELAALLAPHPPLVTDVASVKGPIVGEASRLGLGKRFAGSHPLAGTHRSGFPGAKPDLFHGSVVYICPTAAGEEAAREIGDFWESVLEASTVVIDAESHDRLVAWTSHLPQVVSSALAAALAAGAPRGVSYGRGARDVTRLAASSVEMWCDILLLNRRPIIEALGTFEQAVRELRDALSANDRARLGRWLEEGAGFRAGLDA